MSKQQGIHRENMCASNGKFIFIFMDEGFGDNYFIVIEILVSFSLIFVPLTWNIWLGEIDQL